MRQLSRVSPGRPCPALRGCCASPALTRPEAWHQIQVRTAPLPPGPQWPLEARPCSRLQTQGVPRMSQGSLSAQRGSSLTRHFPPWAFTKSEHLTAGPEAWFAAHGGPGSSAGSCLARRLPAHSAPPGGALPQPGSPRHKRLSPQRGYNAAPCPHARTRGRPVGSGGKGQGAGLLTAPRGLGEWGRVLSNRVKWWPMCGRTPPPLPGRCLLEALGQLRFLSPHLSNGEIKPLSLGLWWEREETTHRARFSRISTPLYGAQLRWDGGRGRG